MVFIINLLYTIIYVVYFLICAPLHVLISGIILLLTFPFDKQRKLQHLYSHFIEFWLISLSLVRVRVRGLEHVDKKQTYIIVCNHQSMLDILFLYKVPTYFKWVSKREAYRIPLVGQLLWMHGDVTIQRGDAKSIRKMMVDCSLWLQRKVSVIMFPEGTRSKNGKVGKFREGAFILAKNNEVPILPVVIDGTRDVFNNRWSLLNVFQVLQMTVLPPIPATEVQQTTAKEMMEKVNQLALETHKKMVPQKYETEG